MFWSNKPPLQASSAHLDCSAKLSRQAKQSMRIEGHGPIVTNYPFSGVRKCTSTNYDLKNQAIPNHIIVWSVTPRKWIWMSPPQNEVIYVVWQPFFHWNSFCGLRSNFMHSLSLCIIMIADVGQRHLSFHIKNWIEISLSGYSFILIHLQSQAIISAATDFHPQLCVGGQHTQFLRSSMNERKLQWFPIRSRC